MAELSAKKSCGKCGVTKPLDHFSRRRDKPDGLDRWCKPCKYAANRAWDAKNRDYVSTAFRKHGLRRRYGLTVEQWEAMSEQQGGGCAICGLNTKGTKKPGLRVDHDHATGAVRGLLCHACNMLLGMAKDDPHILEQAARYLRKARL